MGLLVSAASSAAPPIDLADVAAGIGGFVINGIDPNDQSGNSVSGAGDVNGDGLADLLVGAVFADPGGDNAAGESYVVFGKAGTAAVDLATVAAGGAGAGGFVINGIDPGDESGTSVSGAGDVNGDGLCDIIVGAFAADPGGENAAGESYVVFGKTDTAAVNLAAVALGIGGGFVINGIDPGDHAGLGVSGAGDVNGDGLCDIIVGAFAGDPGGASNAGESYVVFGKATTSPVNLDVVAAGGAGAGGFAINGIDPGDRSGASVSGAGDVNGDGLGDVIVGARSADPGDVSGAGESYVIFGKTSTAPVSLATIAAGAGAGFVINGIDAADSSGWSVSGAGDVNGDGLADLVVGAWRADRVTGESYVIFGKIDAAAVNLADITAGAGGGFVMSGIDPGDASGASTSGAADVNGDGLADVIVGAPTAGPDGQNYAGESYVVFGRTSTAAVNLADIAAGAGDGFVINGIDPQDFSGFSVAGAGDVNGDGLADLLVGALYADAGGDNFAGESYVIFAPAPLCKADIDGSGEVGFNDLTQLLLDWGPCPRACPWDLDNDGDVGFGDLTLLLREWGAC